MDIINRPFPIKLKSVSSNVTIRALVADDIILLFEFLGSVYEGVKQEELENLSAKKLVSLLIKVENKNKLFEIISKEIEGLTSKELLQLPFADLLKVVEAFIEANDFQEIIDSFLSIKKKVTVKDKKNAS